MDATYYREYFELERNHWWFRARKKILRDHLHSVLPKNKQVKILNVGVSTGNSSEMLSEFGEVVSIEYDQDCIDYTTSRIDLKIVQGSILELPFTNDAFDLVCAFDVIEHVDDDQLAVDEMKRVCKKGGIISVTVPAFMFLWSQHDEVNHHFRRYRKNQLQKLFNNKSSFIYATYFNFWMFFPIAPIRILFKIFPFLVKDRKGSGSDFSSPLDSGNFIQSLFYNIFKSERFFVINKLSLPFGVSLLASWKK